MNLGLTKIILSVACSIGHKIEGLGECSITHDVYTSIPCQMLVMRQFDGVEKIKTIGSTYMAAAGLQHAEPNNVRSHTQII